MQRQLFWRKQFEDEDRPWCCISVHFLFFSLSFFILSFLPASHCRLGRLFLRLITLGGTHAHTHTRTHLVGLVWTRGRPDAKTSTCTTHRIHKRQTSMPPAGFEPAIPARERPQTRALDRADTGIGCFSTYDVISPQVL